jgi:RNA polymerase sigma factor (sigma-70 family)
LIAAGSETIVLKQIDNLFRTGTLVGSTDGELLARFVLRRDEGAEAAFTALVERHGAMVMRTCRQVLGDQHDAEDAAQAVFLGLARRSGSIRRRESVASWLHGVALHVASRVQRAAARRRVHERRAVEIARDRYEQQEPRPTTDCGDDRWAELHQELDRLPERFRAPLILLHLEGMTQEQAAAQLRLPLGTLQSRSARGRTQLKARLERRGAGLAIGLLDTGRIAPLASSPSAASAWVETTVKLALRFSLGDGRSMVGAGAASAALATQMVWTMLMAKVRVAVALILVTACMGFGIVTWPRSQPPDHFAAAVQEIPKPPAKLQDENRGPAQPWLQNASQRTVKGIVRDLQGRPVAKAWVGEDSVPLDDIWKLIEPPDRVRETMVPYRDSNGQIVGPGLLGKYFEIRDDRGTWQPVNPADIRKFDPTRKSVPSALPFLEAIDSNPRAKADTARDVAGPSPMELRVRKDAWKVTDFSLGSREFHRTDSHGRFERVVQFFPNFEPVNWIHFASRDFSQQAVHAVRGDEPDRAVEVVLRPVRSVRARVIEAPKDYLRADMEARIYATDVLEIGTSYIEAIACKGAFWGPPRLLDPTTGESLDGQRWLEAALLPGKYRVRFQSETIERLVDIDVPAGEGTLVLPEIRLKTLASLQMLGTNAADIEATDLNGHPVKLAEYRGKVVVLDFWPNADRRWSAGVPRMLRMKDRFKDQPVEFLVIHDASITALPAYREVIAACAKELNIDKLPFHMLLDNLPAGLGTGPYPARAGENGSGRSFDRYEIVGGPATFVIDGTGRLVYALMNRGLAATSYRLASDGALSSEVEDEQPADNDGETFLARSGMDALEGALEMAFGLTPHPRPQAAPRRVIQRPRVRFPFDPEQMIPRGPLFIKGSVFDLNGHPIRGATISLATHFGEGLKATTGPRGDFTLSVELEAPTPSVELKIEAPAMATSVFSASLFAEGTKPATDGWQVQMDEKGVLLRPLVLGPGVSVTGRVVRQGNPVASIVMGLNSLGYGLEEDPPATKTDPLGVFRFEHLPADTPFAAYARHSESTRGGTILPRQFETGKDGTAVDLGDLEIVPGKSLAGRIVFSDGKTPYQKAQVAVFATNAGGAKVNLDDRGRFHIDGLPPGPVWLRVLFEVGKRWQQSPAGYRLSTKNKCLDPRLPNVLRGQLDHDITDLTILFEPGEAPQSGHVSLGEIDPATLADFKDAEAGPITGIPPSAPVVPPLMILP